ncbi:LytR C-terminal domain-containing protein [Arthrobacter sunyaminii]|uniref:LytR C-terminal domain-containing protein n=1 Tax=Arthrobacter sunyaminii TaxID=2816859 RepID=A0A975S6G7_9MICC|nr:LytR C-terminal domain-containing protein [Arthrobacter sunyaminii]MBO0909923.1 LytR C-terminal domain-containing protein [Arthrobacter sunyaminii]QWQ36707.1 LytR C-terminal domain-containing protein [Arthrobacter sunyaminii]
MSNYPRDEFDKVPETSSRQGVHRERLIPSRSSGLGLIITVGVLALVLGVAAYFVLPRLGIGTDDGDRAPAADSSASVESPEPQASEPGQSTEPTPSATAAPSAEPAPTPSPTPSPTPAAADRSQPVVVLNGSGIGGLGASVSARLGADGWTTAQVANWGGQPLQGSIIFYGTEDQLPNAQELSQLLGIPTVVQSPDFTLVTVVPGPGFQ